MSNDHEIAIVLQLSQFHLLAEMLWKTYYATEYAAEPDIELAMRYRGLISQISTHTTLITPQWLAKRLAAATDASARPGPKIAPMVETPTSEPPKPIAGVSN